MFKKIILLLLPFWAFTACNLSDSMLVTPAKQEVPAARASFTISLVITDDDPAWTAECDSAWVTIKPKSGKGDGKINVTVAKNPRKVSRSAAIAIRSASSSVFTYVLQAANDKDESGSGSGSGGNGGNGGSGGSGDNGGSGSGDEGGNEEGSGSEKYDGPYFDLGGGLKVVFAPGNLQYNSAKNEWRFAEHQYDMIGADNNNISSTYNGWIDLFGWGTSGYRSCLPYDITMENEHYGSQGDYDLTGSYANYDWGVYNSSKIKNNPDPSYKWRLLESVDWFPLFENHQHTLATVCGVPGLLVFPKGFEVDEKEISLDDYLHKTVKDEKYLTDNGILFLPAAGRREGSKRVTETTGWYHTATSYASQTIAKGCVIVEFYSSRDDEDGEGYFSTVGEPYGRHFGCAVRLVREVK